MLDLVLKSEIFNEIYSTDKDGIPQFKNFINGEWVFCDHFMDIKSPIDGQVIARVTVPDESTLEEALDTAYTQGREAIQEYTGENRISSFQNAAEMMSEVKEEFIDVLIKTAGKPQSNATGEVEATIERLEKTLIENSFIRGDFIPGDWSEETYNTHGIVKHVPHGLIFTIGPFNYPLFIPATKIIPSLLTGNAILLKPASSDPIATLMFIRILELSGIPGTALTTMTFSGSQSEELLKSDKIHAISFTGSTQTGEYIMKTAGIKNYHMELGGKDPVIVLEDADLDLAAEKIVQGMVKYAGQRCDAIKLVIAHQDIYDELKVRLRTKLEKIKAQDPSEETDALMGPLIDNESADEIVVIYEDAITKGAHALTKYHREGRYIDPLLVETSQEQLPELEFFDREIFGPLTFILPFQDPEHAIGVANSTRFGLDAAIFGEDEAKVHKIANKLEFGAVFVNEYPRHGIGYYPFGGVKDSGVGREGIGYSVNQMTTTKSIVKNYKGYGYWEEI